MAIAKAYDEVIDVIAEGDGPEAICRFRPSDESLVRVSDLSMLEKSGQLSPDDKRELDHYLELEHQMRLAKARANHRLPPSQNG